VVDPSAPEYVYVQLANAIAAQIESGRLQPGARLPGERELAEQYRVSVTSARRAVEDLRERGLARTLHGRGTFITEPPAAGRGDAPE